LRSEDVMIGQTISHYTILENLGEGGMGIVYKARDNRLDRTVALKFLAPGLTASEDDRQRFIREAKNVAALNHPNICTIYNAEEFDGTQFIVMEYMEGKSLAKNLKRGSFKPVTVIEYALQISSALKEAHARGIIHRDIKSDNIMITQDDRVKVMDFGLAKLKGSAKVTQTGKMVGTVTNMSPEQVRGEPADERSDIWSLGIVLYQMLTGELPYYGDYQHAVMYSILNDDPAPISGIIKMVPQDLEKLVFKCLAKNPSDRYQSASVLLNDLSDLRGKIDPGQNEPDYRVDKERARGQIYILSQPVTYAALFLVAVLITVVSAYMFNRDLISHWLTDYSEPELIRLTVLPFNNIGDDPVRQVFCDGLVETITGNLTNFEQLYKNLWVVPSGEVRGNNISSPGEAYRTFGANYAVTGSLQPIRDRLRLTVHLIDSKNLRQINSSVIDVDASDVLALHNQSVENLMKMLNLALEPETQVVMKAGYTTVSAAFEPYIQGVGYLQRYEKIENILAAIDSFMKSIEADPAFALAYAGLGQAYWRKYDYTKEPGWLEKANEYALAAQRLDPDLAQVNITMGMINRGMGQYEKAILNFSNVLSADSTNADAYRELARTYELLGNFSRAESTILHSIELKPGYWSGYNQLGALYLRHNHYEKALEQFVTVIELTPDNYIGYMNLGTTFSMLNRYTDARSMFERSLELETTYDASSNLAWVNFIEGRYREAARMFETALEYQDGNYQVWGNLGSAYYWTPGERDRADSAYIRAIELAERQKTLNPNDPYVVIALAGYHSMTDNADEAIMYARQALAMAPDNSWVLFSAGTIYERHGDREEALRWIGNAVERGHSVSEIMNQPDLQNLIQDQRFQKLIRNVRPFE
jgi:serine/threonine protein kinase/tetratricopeptide (TPR) repeat protein